MLANWQREGEDFRLGQVLSRVERYLTEGRKKMSETRGSPQYIN